MTRRCFFPAAMFALAASIAPGASGSVFNVRDFGATGIKTQNARAALQKAIDACAAAGGGMVYVPPGAYTTGTLHLRSHVRFHIESGATVYSIKDKSQFDQDALFFGADLQGITLEGRGTVDGEGRYEWRPDDIEDDFIRPNEELMLSLGKPILRSFPKKDQFGKLVLLLRCRDVRIEGLNFVDSPSWTIHPYGCERLAIDGVHISSSLRDGVWADGIDPDGCRDVRISNCTIETGDDALVFYSMDWFGPALPCESITVTNCRLTSASSALKFCDGNMNAIRNVTVDNCVLAGANRGIAFMNFDGGIVENVVLSNLVVDCRRFDWFWWGDGDPFHFNIKKRDEVHRNFPKDKVRPAGTIRNVKIQNVIARGHGSSVCQGHPDSWLEDITLENVRLAVAHDPAAPYDKAVNAMEWRWAKNLKIRGLDVVWEEPGCDKWENALRLTDIRDVEISGFSGRQAARLVPGGSGRASGSGAAIALVDVEGAVIRSSRALAGTDVFVSLAGPKTRDVVLAGNDVRSARALTSRAPDLAEDPVTETGTIYRKHEGLGKD